MKKVLIIRFSSIGDIVLTTPVIRCLKNQQPETEIHYLTKKAFSAVLKANPYIDKIHEFDRDLGNIIQNLLDEDFDYIVDLHRNLRSRIVKSRLQKPTGTFSKLNRSKWILVNAKINLLPDIHLVERYFKAVEKTGVSYDGEGLDYFILNEEQMDMKEFVSSDFSENYMLVVVGGKHKTKKIPEHKLVRICNEAGFPVILSGGKEDIQQAEAVAGQLSVPVYNTCGRHSINESAYFVKKATVVLSPDTGLMHIAAAFRKPLITLWGNTVPAFGMYPFLPDNEKYRYRIHEIKDLNCRPCSKIGFERCPQGHFRCMNEIKEEEVLKSIREVVKTYK
ncbi:MAG: glycosyltransferase family 9 protein [Bacteroidales bacterium]|nr:glycosyltransferase family 9 protein [Bacteroidales bacterium]